MRRADTLLAIVVGALVVFVGLRVATRPPSKATPAPELAGAPLETPSAPPAITEPPPTTVRTSLPAPERDLAQIRARIAETPGTYMGDMLDDLQGTLLRWPDRRATGLRIWVQTITPVADWDLRYAQTARDAFDDWSHDELPLRFDFVNDSASSDIRVVWRDRFAADQGTRVGVTRRWNDQHGWLVAAEIDVAIHDSTSRVIPPEALTGIIRHEAGHALGMGHSRDPRTKMYPFEMTPEIAAADRATLRLLYSLPPGSVR